MMTSKPVSESTVDGDGGFTPLPTPILEGGLSYDKDQD